MFRRLLRRIAPTIAWWLDCPRTVEGAAEDFLRHQNGGYRIEVSRAIASLPSPEAEAPYAYDLAWKRRIACIYGVATRYGDPRGERGRAGWNRALLADCRASGPEAAVEVIFRRVWEMARQEIESTATEPRRDA